MGINFNTIYRIMLSTDGRMFIHAEQFTIDDIKRLSSDERKELKLKLQDLKRMVEKNKELIKRGVKSAIIEDREDEHESLIDPDTGEKKRRKRRTKAEMAEAKIQEDRLRKLGIKRVRKGRKGKEHENEQ